MVGVAFPMIGGPLYQPLFDFQRRLSRRQAGAVGNPEDMGVDGDGRLAEGDVEHHVGGLAPDPRQCLELLPVAGNLAPVFVDQDLA